MVWRLAPAPRYSLCYTPYFLRASNQTIFGLLVTWQSKTEIARLRNEGGAVEGHKGQRRILTPWPPWFLYAHWVSGALWLQPMPSSKSLRPSRRRTFWGTWTAMTTQGDTIGLGQDRHPPPPIDQTTGHYQRGSNRKHCNTFGVISCLIKFQVKRRL